MNDVECPYCEAEQAVFDHPDWDEPGFDAQCTACGKWFTVNIEVHYEYSAEKDDALNQVEGT